MPYLAPSSPKGVQVVFAPDFFAGRIPLLRLSFGMESRIEPAAEALAAALGKLGEQKADGGIKRDRSVHG